MLAACCLSSGNLIVSPQELACCSTAANVGPASWQGCRADQACTATIDHMHNTA